MKILFVIAMLSAIALASCIALTSCAGNVPTVQDASKAVDDGAKALTALHATYGLVCEADTPLLPADQCTDFRDAYNDLQRLEVAADQAIP